MSTESYRGIPTHEIEQHFAETVNGIEQAGIELGLEHRFVGGTVTDLIIDGTVAVFDHGQRVVHLSGHGNFGAIREGDRTISDVDMVSLTPDGNAVKAFRHFLLDQEAQARRNSMPHPNVGFEPADYPGRPARRIRLPQLTSGIRVTHEGDYVLTFPGIEQQVAPATMAGWQYQLHDLPGSPSITSFNPHATALRYPGRTASGYKLKDIQSGKLERLQELSRQFREDGLLNDIDYLQLHWEWIEFLEKFLFDQDASTRVRALATDVYWNRFQRLSTALAHGKGVFGPVQRFSNKFGGN